jgi:hypothetical protein
VTEKLKIILKLHISQINPVSEIKKEPVRKSLKMKALGIELRISHSFCYSRVPH